MCCPQYRDMGRAGVPSSEKRSYFQHRRISRRCVIAFTCGALIACTLLYVAVHFSTLAFCQASINMTVVLHHQHRVIAAQMEAANTSADWRTEHLLDNGGEPMRNIIVTTWRSGSTFFNAILNNQPGNFDHYEPFHSLGIINIDFASNHRARRMLRSILNCDYSLFTRPLYDTVLFSVNKILASLLPKHCFFRELIEPICRLFPSQSMKLIRLRLRHLHALMREMKNVRVFYLVRDPRGTLASRHHLDWCVTPTCNNAASVCGDLVDDYRAALTLAVDYPTRFRVIRYEDLAGDPEVTVKELFLGTGMVYDERVVSFLKAHTSVNKAGDYSTYRNSSENRFKWRKTMNYTEVTHIQKACSLAMNSWGYLPVTSVDLLGTFMPTRSWQLF